MRSIATHNLIAEDFVAFTRSQFDRDGVLDLYLHTPGGAVQVGGGGFGTQTITSLPISGSDQQFFEDVVRDLDRLLALDFRFTSDPSTSDIRLYYDTEINIDGGETLGLASSNSEGGRDWWELFLNVPAFGNDQSYLRYALIHEFGHSLGLEHPFDNSDGDSVDGITDPWLSVFPEDTVMAYRDPLGNSWPNAFTTNDRNALIDIWGAERHSDTPVSTSGPSRQLLGTGADVRSGSGDADWINGSRGDDRISGEGGDDLVRGGKDDDWLNGNTGADRVYGDRGDDIVRGGKDDDWLNGNAGEDRIYGDRGDDLVRGGKNDDWLDGGLGDDDLWGDRGADRIRLSAGNDTVWEFSYDSGDRLEISYGLSYSLTEVKGDLQVRTSIGTTTLDGIKLAGFQSDAIVLA